MNHTSLRNMNEVARAIALPGESPPVRFPSFPALERTSVLSFNAPRPWAVTNGTRRVILTRQAAYPLWLDDNPETGSFGTTYTVGWKSDERWAGATGDTQMDFTGGLDYAQAGPNSQVLWNPSVIGNVGVPACTYPVVGVDPRNRTTPYVWIPAGASVRLSTIPNTPSAASTSWKINGQRWLPGGDAIATTTNTTLAANSAGNAIDPGFVAGGPGGIWWRPVNLTCATLPAAAFATLAITVFNSISGGNIAQSAEQAIYPVQFTVSGTTNTVGCFLPAVAPNEYAASTIPWQSTRATAVAALFTNTTKVLNKEGTVLWGRLNPDHLDTWNFQSSTLSVLHPTEKSYMALETGTYAFVPPSTDQANFWDHTITLSNTQVNSGFTQLPVYRLDNTSLVLAANFADPDSGTNMAINLDWHIEFRNTSALFPIALSRMQLESFHQAQLALVEAGFFYHNESHTKVLSKVLSTIKKYAPQILNLHPVGAAAVKAFKMVKGAYNGGPGKGKKGKEKKYAHNFMGPLPRGATRLPMNVKPKVGAHTPKTTSGKRSGIK